MRRPLVVVTGVPHAGKTTLVRFLGSRGYLTQGEAARDTIERNLLTGGPLPWSAIGEFTAQLWPQLIEQHVSAIAARRACVFDRGLPDAIAFLRVLGGTPTSGMLKDVAIRHYTHVFMLDEVPRGGGGEDPMRPFSRTDIQAIEGELLAVYEGLGYEVRRIPVAPVEVRASHLALALEGGS